MPHQTHQTHLRAASRMGYAIGLALAVSSMVTASPAGAQQDRAAMMRYCDHIDSVSAPTLAGIRDRTDCWKRIQLEGLSNALVEDRYKAAVRDYDAAVASDSLKRANDAREAQVDQQLSQVQRALVARDLSLADSVVTVVLRVQAQNPRALAFRERIQALQHANGVRRTINMAAGVVVVLALLLASSASVIALRQRRAADAERAKAALRTAMVRIVDGVGRGKMYTLSGPLFRIGSAVSDRPEEKNDLVLSDAAAYVSRYHCAIIRRDGNYYLIDSSLNGTYVDDKLLERGEPRLLEDGAEFTLSGVTRLKFLLV